MAFISQLQKTQPVPVPCVTSSFRVEWTPDGPLLCNSFFLYLRSCRVTTQPTTHDYLQWAHSKQQVIHFLPSVRSPKDYHSRPHLERWATDSPAPAAASHSTFKIWRGEYIFRCCRTTAFVRLVLYTVTRPDATYNLPLLPPPLSRWCRIASHVGSCRVVSLMK